MQQAYHSPERWRHLFDRIGDVARRRPRRQGPGRAPTRSACCSASRRPPTRSSSAPSYGEVAHAARSPSGSPRSRDPERQARDPRRARRRWSPALPDGLFRQIVGGFDVMFEMSRPGRLRPRRVDVARPPRRPRRGRRPGRARLRRAARSATARQLLYLPLFNFAHGDFDDIHEMITSPLSLFGLSDAGAHCGAICDASATTSLPHRLGPRPRDGRSGSRSRRSSTS